MKIISHNENRIIYKEDEYVVKTPIGIFKDINEAIQVYPSLKEVDRVKQCKYCGKYFLRVGVKDNSRVYCSEKCLKKSHSEMTNANYYNKIFVEPDPYKVDKYAQHLKDIDLQMDTVNPKEFKQNDNYWGLGTGNLTGTPANNPEKEHQYIQHELKRLGLK